MKLEKPSHVSPPFRLDSLSEQQLAERVRELCARKYPVVNESPGTDVRADLVVIKPDELLGGGDVIVIELKQFHGERLVPVEAALQLEHYTKVMNAAQGWLMTNRHFAPAVRAYAKNQPWLKLFDRER